MDISVIKVLGPIPALMEKRAGYYRAQLLLHASQRTALQRLLNVLVPQINALKIPTKLRWNLDVDPYDMF